MFLPNGVGVVSGKKSGGGGISKNKCGTEKPKYRMGKKYHGVKKSMDVGIGCATQSVMSYLPFATKLGGGQGSLVFRNTIM